MTEARTLEVLRGHAVRTSVDAAAARLLDAIDSRASLVLVGEATHGTGEFYAIRAALTERLIAERGFGAVAVEADWPDAWRVSRWVHGDRGDPGAAEALGDFTRFPRWMWRNREVVGFLERLRVTNAARAHGERVGFYGLDLYSLHRSMAHVIEYLDVVDPMAARKARDGYACFDRFGDPQQYGYAASLGLTRTCEEEVVSALASLRRHAAQYAARDGRLAADAHFVAEQNAHVVQNAESYYRAMVRGGAASWNLRDRHMMATLDALLRHLAATGRAPRVVVWAHNSHLGDARATGMSARGEINLGQLVRERFGPASCLVGMTTHDGTVTAAREWEGPSERRRVRPSLEGSYERLFHETGLETFVLDMSVPDIAAALARPRLERAIGVIYRPETERPSHYFSARLADQFDLVVHVDRTHALHPLEIWARHEADLPETWPTGV